MVCSVKIFNRKIGRKKMLTSKNDIFIVIIAWIYMNYSIPENHFLSGMISANYEIGGTNERLLQKRSNSL